MTLPYEAQKNWRLKFTKAIISTIRLSTEKITDYCRYVVNWILSNSVNEIKDKEGLR
jgi:hypothetical protein